jgi:hypothetical protein
LDHIERGNIDFSCIRTIVLDEADQMLKLGFKEDIEKNPSKYIRDRAVNEAEKNNQIDVAKKQSDSNRDSEAAGDGANKTAGA